MASGVCEDDTLVVHLRGEDLPAVHDEGVEDRDEVRRGVALPGDGGAVRERHAAPPP